MFKIPYSTFTHNKINVENRLHIAIKQNNTQAVQKLLNLQEIKINWQNDIGETALFLAVKSKSYFIADILLTVGANPNICNIMGDSPLHIAVGSGLANISKLLINKGSFLNAQNFQGSTPLHKAVISGNTLIIEELTNAKADLNICDYFGNSPLYYAALNNNNDVMIKLISLGGDIKKISVHQDFNQKTLTILQASDPNFCSSHLKENSKFFSRLNSSPYRSSLTTRFSPYTNSHNRASNYGQKYANKNKILNKENSNSTSNSISHNL
ncbi:MAG: ankyrin repeat domain-containing protein [Alphaproteobacteria bacterium]